MSASARSFTPLRASAPSFQPNLQLLTPDRAATRIQSLTRGNQSRTRSSKNKSARNIQKAFRNRQRRNMMLLLKYNH